MTPVLLFDATMDNASPGRLRTRLDLSSPSAARLVGRRIAILPIDARPEKHVGYQLEREAPSSFQAQLVARRD